MFDISFYKNKKVLLTGHTGFKGTWMSIMLVNAGANLTGYSLGTEKEYSLFEMSGVKTQINHITGDIRDLERLKAAFKECQPEIVIHMAAQPIVSEGYIDPVYTYETNVLGTVNILECVRLNSCVKSFLNVTTDKVYENKEWIWGYRENEVLNGFDPYSNSKSCSELVTCSYKNSFFGERKIGISTARAGNVIGGGDFAKNRIIPDCIRAAIKGRDIVVRNPHSIRPYQHVLEPVFAYLMIAAKQYENIAYAGSYNVGPDDNECLETEILVKLFVEYWGGGLKWINHKSHDDFHEANFLKLDSTKLKKVFHWTPRWNLEQAIKRTVEWSKCWISNGNVRECMDTHINDFLKGY